MADSITQAEYDSWIPAPEAFEKLTDKYNEVSAALSALRRRLETGLLRAVASDVIERTPEGPIGRKLVLIQPVMWSIIDPPYESHLWISGEIDVDLRGSGRYAELEEPRHTSLLGVRFDRAGLIALNRLFAETEQRKSTALSAPIEPISETQPRRGGAPRKGWWDDLWIEVLRRVQDGRLRSDTAPSGSRLEYVLLDIAQELGFSPGESTLKPMALKLFTYLKENGGK